MPIDITDPALVTRAAEIAGDTTLLVNNAGPATYQGLLHGPMDDIRAEMEGHYFGSLLVTRAFAPQLIANAPGTVLNVLLVLAWRHVGHLGAYCAAKAALWSQTDSIREEFKPHGVNVTALHVGNMDTDRLAHVNALKSDPAIVAAAALDGVEHDLIEVLADADTRAVKAGMSADRGAAATG